MCSTAWPINSVTSKSKMKSPPLTSLSYPGYLANASHSIVRICSASSFSYRSMQHISTWLLENYFLKGITQVSPSIVLSDQIGQLLSIAIVKENSYHCHCCREGVLPYWQVRATLSYHCHCCREGILPFWQVPFSQHLLPVAVSPLSLGESVTAQGLT